jgi:hypothetical protein
VQREECFGRVVGTVVGTVVGSGVVGIGSLTAGCGLQ